MSNTPILVYVLGFIGQAMFGARLVAQWIYAERAGRVVSPTIFWIFSVLGSSIFLLYGVLRHDLVILVGQTISFYIYVRNLQLKKAWSSVPLWLQIPILLIPPVMLTTAFLQEHYTIASLLPQGTMSAIFIAGVFGQLMLNFRYFYQWYYSEKANESLLPFGFWLISAIASVMVIMYALSRRDPVLSIAQSLGLVAYLRNIWIYLRSKRQ